MNLEPELLLELAQVSARLDTAADELNLHIAKLEAEIRATGARCVVELLIEEGLFLKWSRLNHTWGLCAHETSPEERTYELAKAPRGVRIDAVKLVPALVRELVKRSQEMINDVESARAVKL